MRSVVPSEMSQSRPRLFFSRGTLLLESAHGALPGALADGVAWKRDPRVGAWRCDALEYPRLAPHLAGLGIEDAVPGWTPVRWPRTTLHTLRPEQKAAVDHWVEAGRRGFVVMPTGTGKTEVALAIIASLNTATLVVAPVRDLMYQWHRRIQAGLGIDAGIIGDGVFRVSPVSVTTYDSACIHMERLGATFGLIVFDECHHLPGGLRRDAARMCAAPFRLGLTATPERSDGRHANLASLIGPKVYELPLPSVKGQALADYDVVRIPVHLEPDEQARYDDLSGIIRRHMHERRKTHPDYSWQDLCSEIGRDPEARRAQKAWWAKKSIEDRAREKLRVLEDIFRLHAGSRIIVFAGSNVMAREVSLRFLLPCLLSHCRKKERHEILSRFAEGTYPVIVANQVLDEGVDVPAAKVAVVIGGLASTRQARQRLGRILRPSGDERAVLYEVVCAETTEEQRSRRRRRSDAFEAPARRTLPPARRR